MSQPHGPDQERRFRRRLTFLAAIALAGMLVLAGRVVWLQAF